MQVPGSMAAGSILFSFLADREKVFEPDAGIGAVEIEVAQFLESGTEFQKRSKTVTAARGGRYRTAAPVGKGEKDFDIAVDATLRQAAVRRARGGTSTETRLVERADLRKKEFVRPCRNLIVFLVDSSDSMGSGAQARMKAAKGAVLAILRKAYQERSEVAMVAFGGDRARVVLPPTSSVDVARRLLDRLPTGGATPFADGLFQAWQIIRSERLKNRGIRPILLIVSDGEANVAMTEGADPQQELAALAGKIGQDGIPAIVIDAAAEPGRRRLLQPVAGHMKAAFVTMRDITAPRLLKTIRGAR
jgi:magnesium chelatase subunit D